MRQVHAFWSSPNSSLCLWCEDLEHPVKRREKVDHPFAASPDTLASLVEAPSEALGEGVVTLPSSERGPTPSPRLWPWREHEPPTALEAWRAPIVRLTSAAAVPWLLEERLDAKESGPSVQAMGELARLAVTLVARGRIVPAIRAEDDGARAVWRPALDPAHQQTFATLAERLPAMCRAGVDTKGASLEVLAGLKETAARHQVAMEALSAFVDAVARLALAAEGAPQAVFHPFLRALTSRGPLGRRGVQALQDDMRAWVGAEVAALGDFDLMLRLNPPEELMAEWHLEFLVRSVEDPSLILTARSVWRSEAGRRLSTASVASERLLAHLGRAAHIFPPIRAALEDPNPTGVDLSTEQAWGLLGEKLPVLKAAGIVVQAPALQQTRPRSLGAKLVEIGGGPHSIGAEGISRFEWRVALGDQELTKEELARLAELKVPLVRFRGDWVEVDADRLEKTMEAIAGGQELSTVEVLRLSAGLDEGPGGLEVVGLEAHGKLAELLEGKADRIRFRNTPESFVGELRKYQRRGLSWLDFLEQLGLGACLADDMGLGKTIQLLALMAAERDRLGESPGPTLLICPTSVVSNWRHEARRFVPTLRSYVHHGGDRLEGDAFVEAVAQRDLVITTYGVTHRDRDLLGRVTWHRVAVDEAQNIKNPSAKQTQAVMALSARNKTALTGTPVENRLMELWSIMTFLNPGLLGTRSTFKNAIATPIERYGDARKVEVLRKVCGPFVLRRLKTDKSIIDDLPDKMEFKEYCNLSREQASLYQATLDDMMSRIDECQPMERRGLVLSTMTRLKQICVHPALLLKDGSPIGRRSGKLARLAELLDTVLAADERALIFTQFAQMGHRLQPWLSERFGAEVLWLHGGTPQKKRQQMVDRFQAEGGPPIFLISLRAGGTGLTLTAANHVVHLDRWWNPAVEDQATDRAYRIGQTRDVQVRKLICGGTLEERIDEMIESKKALAESVISSGEEGITELSTDALRELMTLSAEALSDAGDDE